MHEATRPKDEGMQSKRYKMPIRAVIYRENGEFVAHCLEFDLVGCGDTPKHAITNMCDAIFAQVEEVLRSGNFGNLFSPADSAYFQMFAAGKNVTLGELCLAPETPVDCIEIEQLEAREYSDSDLIPA